VVGQDQLVVGQDQLVVGQDQLVGGLHHNHQLVMDQQMDQQDQIVASWFLGSLMQILHSAETKSFETEKCKIRYLLCEKYGTMMW
jgi:hypothetical protein